MDNLNKDYAKLPVRGTRVLHAGPLTILAAVLLSSAVCYAGARDETHYAKAQELINEYKTCRETDGTGKRTVRCDRKALRNRAIRELTRAIGLDPKRPEYHLARGILYRDAISEVNAASEAKGVKTTETSADVDRALTDFSTCADLSDGAHAELRYECRKESARLLCANKREQEGYAIINSLISKNASDLPGGDFYRTRYDCSDKSDKEQNVSDLNKAIELYLKQKDYDSPSVLSDLYFELFSEHREMKRYREALDDIDRYGKVCRDLSLGCDQWALKGYALATRAEMNRPAKWTRVAATDTDVFFLDKASVLFRSPSYRMAWIRTEPSEDNIIASSQQQRDLYHYQYDVTRWHFDCDGRRYAVDTKIYYNIDGGVVSSHTFDPQEMILPVEQGAVSENLLNAVCGLEHEGQDAAEKAAGPSGK